MRYTYVMLFIFEALIEKFYSGYMEKYFTEFNNC